MLTKLRCGRFGVVVGHLMRPIRLPKPPIASLGLPDIGSTIRRAVVIGNGFAGAENPRFGLVRALGLSHRQSLYIFEGWSYPPLNDIAEAAGRVIQALVERGWRLQP